MKIVCQKEKLHRGLTVVGRAVATRSPLPITGSVLLSAEESRLKLAATNLEIAITCYVNAKVEEEGAVAIPAKVFTDFVNLLPSEPIEISASPEANIVELRCARYKAHINGQNPEEFPPIPQIEEGVSVRVDPELLRQGIEQVIFAAATEESRPVLTGAFLEVEGDTMNLVAADGFRLAVRTLPLSSPAPESFGVIVPARSLNELQRLLRDEEEDVEIVVNPQRSQASFKLKEAEMVTQLIQGTYPNYKQLIPQTWNTKVIVNLKEFYQAIRSASIFAKDGGIIRLYITPGTEFGPGKITVSAHAEEIGDNTGEVEAIVEGEESKIAFNYQYLLDVLSVLKEPQIILRIITPSSPGVIAPLGKEDYIHIIMPMFVHWSRDEAGSGR